MLSSMLVKTSEDGTRILVGQTAKENDKLTQTADPDHYWFHAADCPGAHVIVEATSMSRETKRDAATLAAHYSKASGMKMVPVDYCKVSHVYKEEHAHHGEVRLDVDHVTTLTLFSNKELGRLRRLL